MYGRPTTRTRCRSSDSIRIIVALVMATFALISYLGSAVTNPITR